MNEKEFPEKFYFKKNEGWKPSAFSENKDESFYQTILENDCLCLCWVTFQKKINPDELNTHHFVRNDFTTTGIHNSLPRFLMVHDGIKWFVSKINDDQFVEIKYDDLLKLLMEDLINVCALLKNKKYLSVKINLKKTIQLMKSYLNKVHSSNKNKWFGPRNITERLTSSDVEDAFMSIEEVKEIRDKIRDKIFDSKLKEANDLRATMHLLLLRTYTAKQLAALTACRMSEFIYVQAGLIHSRLIFIPLEIDMYDSKFKKEAMRGPYYEITKNGEVVPFELNEMNAETVLRPGFVRFSKTIYDELFSRKRYRF